MLPIRHSSIRLRFALWTALALLSSNGLSEGYQNLKFNQINTALGLPGETVRAVGQDTRGVIWLGTEVAGIVSYDGSEFVAYKHDPETPGTLSANYVESILIDSSNRLWVGTNNGLNLFDHSSRLFTHFEEAEQEVGHGTIFSIEEDGHGNIWFGGNEGIARYNPDTGDIRYYKTLDEFDGTQIAHEYRFIHYASSGMLVIGTRNGLFQYDAEHDRIKPSPYNEIAKRNGYELLINSIDEDENGDFWLSTLNGLARYDPSRNEIEMFRLGFDQSQGAVPSTISLIDSRGLIWAGTFFDGVRIKDLNADPSEIDSSDFMAPSALKTHDVRTIYEDRNGLIWIGTEEQGVFVYDSKSVTFPYYPGSVVADSRSNRTISHVRAIVEDHEGILWLGTLLDGIVGYNRETNTYMRLREDAEAGESGLLSINTRAVIEDRSKSLWFGTTESLLRFGPDRKFEAHYPSPPIREILEASDGLLYIGSVNGLLVFSPTEERFIDFPEFEGIDRNTFLNLETNTMLEDSKGIIWIGSRKDGLFRYDPINKRVTNHLPNEEDPANLGANMIRGLLEDEQGNLWIGTKGAGLSKYSPESNSFEYVGIRDGLPTKTVYSIVNDDIGNLWLGMHDGLARYNPQTDELSVFSKEYGLQGNRFDDLNGAIRCRNGELIFSGRYGFNLFDPREIEKREQISNTIITSFKLLDDELIGEIREGEPFQITHDTNYITLSFALTDYTAPKRNEFVYLLEGFDEEWIYSGTRNYATYTELPAGQYTFRVKGKTPTGDWPDESYSLGIVVTPPFWLTKAFVALSTAVVLGGSILIYAFLTMRSRWQRRRLEQLVEERTEKWQSANLLLEESKHNLEAKVQERTKDLTERTKDLVEANRRAEKALLEAQKADKLKSAFLANMSHEIRTPMNAILGFSSMLNDFDLSSEEKRNFMNAIESNGQELLSLVNDILDISIIEAGQVKLVRDEVDLFSLFGVLNQSYKIALAKQGKDKKVALIWSNQVEVSNRLVTDETRLRQVLSNFLSNAVKFTDEGTIEFGYKVESNGQWVRFFVSDTGIGIREDQLQAIFDRFRKIEDEGERLYRGSGLGLSISKQLAELLGGEISVESTLGEGSTFHLRLPLAPSDDSLQVDSPATNTAIEEKQSDGAPPETPHEQSLLIVAEDEDSNFAVIESMLRNETVKIVRAVDGMEVIDKFRKYSEAKAILMDIKMPRMGGVEAARQIRERNKTVPIIAHTAHALSSERSEIMNGDFDSYLAKPISRSQLINCLKPYL